VHRQQHAGHQQQTQLHNPYADYKAAHGAGGGGADAPKHTPAPRQMQTPAQAPPTVDITASILGTGGGNSANVTLDDRLVEVLKHMVVSKKASIAGLSITSN
jgi:hypothetical protein